MSIANKILNYVSKNPGKTANEIAAAIGSNRGTVSGQLSTMRKGDKVVSENGRFSLFVLPPLPEPEPTYADTATEEGTCDDVRPVEVLASEPLKSAAYYERRNRQDTVRLRQRLDVMESQRDAYHSALQLLAEQHNSLRVQNDDLRRERDQWINAADKIALTSEKLRDTLKEIAGLDEDQTYDDDVIVCRAKQVVGRTVIEARTAEGALRAIREQQDARIAELEADRNRWMIGHGDAVIAGARLNGIIEDADAALTAAGIPTAEPIDPADPLQLAWRIGCLANQRDQARKPGTSIRLEWSTWENDETSLTMFVGGFRTIIAEITPEDKQGSVFYSGALEGEKATVRGPSLDRIIHRLATLIEDAGLTMPPVPPLPTEVK